MKTKTPDVIIFLTVLTLLGIGIIMVFSSSAVISIEEGQNQYLFLIKQTAWAVLGTILMILFMKIDYRLLRRYALLLYFISIVLLALVLVFGQRIQGATRWFSFLGFSFQPSEIAKLALIILLALYLSETESGVKHFWLGIGIPILFFIPVGALIMLEPDLGTTITIFGTVVIMMVIAGTRWSHLSFVFLIGLVAAVILIIIEPYRLRRLTAWRNPFSDPLNTGDQVIQSLYGLGSGGLLGVGLGQGRQKFKYLPQPHSDFIFATLGEELGFVGASLVVGLFFVIAWRGFKIAIECNDAFGSLLASGITALIATQAVINIGVVTASLPATGITLPLISSGGSSLVITMIGIGILLNISKHA